ncbi:DUF2946 family protein [Aquincola sp. MAHUQ-54]|uniref:DUF2946 family protein n=1 Tax=Aquincola agrisoli TaxID=3119538 RepID=A0AAW9QGF8_9BURK
MNAAVRSTLLRRSAWAALLAMLWLAFAPMVSHALAAGAAPWSEVCSADGARRAPAAPRDASQHLLEHCPFCAGQPLASALPSVQAAFMPEGRAHTKPSLRPQAPRRLPVWRHASSRGPPSFA